MAATAVATQGSARSHRPRRIAVMPAYNEQETIVSVLTRLEQFTDQVIVVDDGSRDRTRETVLAWAGARSDVKLIGFERNRGMSAAYYRAFRELESRVSRRDLDADTLVLTVDADGQHEPSEVDGLVAQLQDNRFDAVIARRDLSSYSRYKRLGNFLISLWASAWAGRRLYDVESGYRIFRLSALLQAMHYYQGFRYSETVEVAVILPRLGCRVDNSFVVPVPIFRSRTRLKDLVIDIAAIPAAAWRVFALRKAPAGFPRLLSLLLPLIVPIGLVLMAVSVLSHSLFLSSDSVQHYSHVWYISTQLFGFGRLPLHIALLDGGHAMTFPYAFVPYMGGALLYQVFGDWGVTLLQVCAALGTLAAVALARPALRDPWLLLLFLLNPFFIDSLYAFQFASLWSALFFFLFVWAFEGRRRLLAMLFAWLTLTSHPLMGSTALAGYAAYAAWRREPLGRLLAVYATPIVAALPFFWMTLEVPAAGENSVLALTASLLDSVVRRSTVLFLPLALALSAEGLRRHYTKTLTLACCGLAVGLGFSAGLVQVGYLNRGTYSGIFHADSDMYQEFLQSPSFDPGGTYRLLEPTDREEGIYRFMKQGAVISNELFSESMMRRDWYESQFSCYASFKAIDFDVVETEYDRRYQRNESSLLKSLSEEGRVAITYQDPQGWFTVYDLRPLLSTRARPQSLRECGL